MQKSPLVIENNFVNETVQVEDSIVQDVVDSTNDEAGEIIAQAAMKAEVMLREAEQQAESMKQKAYEEGYQQGHEQGREQGYQEGLTQGRQSGQKELETAMNQAVAKTELMVTAAAHDAKEMMKNAERQIVDIALAVARKILAYEISENPMVVLPLVKAALEKVSDQEEIVIRVSSEDFDSVLMAKKDLQNMVGREHALKIIPDRTIDSGSCVIDTSYGTVDARIDTQFAIIKKVLQDLGQ